jgi:hypothetical protein
LNVAQLGYTGVSNSTTGLLQADRCDNNVQESETDREIDRQTGRHAYRQTDRQAGRQAGRQADRQIGGQTDRPDM